MGSSLNFSGVATSQHYPSPQSATFVARNFQFHTGETIDALNIHYTTIGQPTGMPVLVLHGTTGSGLGMLNAAFAGELFGSGQPLDAAKYFIILPDAIGTGQSSKPSDGLRANFPRYNYDDMVQAQHRLITEHLNIKRLRLVLGNSMGGMQTWLWAMQYPTMMDIAVPMASLPIVMSGRNWMMRRWMIDSIRRDPAWDNGNYTTQPPSLAFASTYFAAASSGGNQGLMKAAPNAAAADAWLDTRLNAPFVGDANDHLFQWESSRDYDPSEGLERIQAQMLIINSADDERNPVDLCALDIAIKRIKHARSFIIPSSPETIGHGTTAQAKFWKHELVHFLVGIRHKESRPMPTKSASVT
jgi:homoserine O-acetyltransferase/O-succinyltransferase